MPDTKFWSLKKGEDATDIYIMTEIANVESWWFDVETPRMFKADLAGVRGELRVWLDSPGGDVFAGTAIYDMLREYSASGRGKTVAMVSMAASAASLIAMACDEIRISVVGTIMIHEPWSTTSGRAAQLRATADVLEGIRDAQIRAYAKRTGQTEAKIMELMQGSDGEGTYMNAMQAVELGFADAIMHGDKVSGEEEIKALITGMTGGLEQDMTRLRIASAIRRSDARIDACIEQKAREAAEESSRRNEAREKLMRALLTTYNEEE